MGSSGQHLDGSGTLPHRSKTCSSPSWVLADASCDSITALTWEARSGFPSSAHCGGLEPEWIAAKTIPELQCPKSDREHAPRGAATSPRFSVIQREQYLGGRGRSETRHHAFQRGGVREHCRFRLKHMACRPSTERSGGPLPSSRRRPDAGGPARCPAASQTPSAPGFRRRIWSNIRWTRSSTDSGNPSDDKAQPAIPHVPLSQREMTSIGECSAGHIQALSS